MKKFWAGLLLLAFVVPIFAGCASQKPNWQESVQKQGVTLNYHFKKGDTAVYRIISTNDMSQEVMGQTQEFSTVTRSVLHYQVKDVQKNGNFIIQASIDSLTISGSNPALAQVQGFLDKARNKPVTLIVTPKGKVQSVKGLEAFPTFQGAGNWKETFTSLFIHLPEKPVKIGDSWDETEVKETGSKGLKITVTGKQHTILKGIAVYKNKPCLNLAISGDLDLSGKGNQAGMAIEFSGTGSFSGKVYFDPTASSYWLFTSDHSTDGTATISSRNMEIPTTTTSSVKIERIK